MVNPDGETAAPPTATNSNSGSEAEVGSRAGSDFVGEAMRWLDGQAVNKPDADQEPAQASADASVTDGTDAQSDADSDSQSKTEQNTLTPGVKKRIDSLTAKYRKELDARKSMALENARLKEAVRLYTSELERVAQFAKLDPNQEKIRELELQREIDALEAKLPGNIEKQFGEAAREAEINDRAAEIADAIRGAAAEWDGLFSPRELALYMQSARTADAAAAAKELGTKRLNAAQTRSGTRPAAPSTAAVSAGAGRDSAAPWKYQGQSSILDFFETQNQLRSKKR
jgi:hypothetical protein